MNYKEMFQTDRPIGAMTGRFKSNHSNTSISDKTTELSYADAEVRILANMVKNDQCLHDLCFRCKGTGKDSNGAVCIHGIACSCSKCSIR